MKLLSKLVEQDIPTISILLHSTSYLLIGHTSTKMLFSNSDSITLGDIFSFMELLLISMCGVYLIWFLLKFSSAMSAWSDLHNMMLGY